MRENFGRGDRTAIPVEKYDPSLNDLVLKIRTITTREGLDPFVQFKQGTISKKELVVLIASIVKDATV